MGGPERQVSVFFVSGSLGFKCVEHNGLSGVINSVTMVCTATTVRRLFLRIFFKMGNSKLYCIIEDLL